MYRRYVYMPTYLCMYSHMQIGVFLETYTRKLMTLLSSKRPVWYTEIWGGRRFTFHCIFFCCI